MDGETHINVYSKGKTGLGRKLSNFYKCRVNTPHGEFMSIEGYWYWLSCKDERLRRMWGYKAKKYGRKVGGVDYLDENEFKTYIQKAITDKILNNKDILEPFIHSELPFEHYYVYGGKKVYPDSGKWVIQYISWLRSFLKKYYNQI